MVSRIIVGIANQFQPLTTADQHTLETEIEEDLKRLPIPEKGKKPGGPMEWFGFITRHWAFKLALMYVSFRIARSMVATPEPEDDQIGRLKELMDGL